MRALPSLGLPPLGRGAAGVSAVEEKGQPAAPGSFAPYLGVDLELRLPRSPGIDGELCRLVDDAAGRLQARAKSFDLEGEENGLRARRGCGHSDHGPACAAAAVILQRLLNARSP